MKKTAGGEVTRDAVERWTDDFDDLWNHASTRFFRHDLRTRAKRYVQGLLGRKNGWQMAEYLGDATPHAVQRLLGSARWCADKLRDEVLRYAREHLVASRDPGVLVARVKRDS